MKRFGAFLAVAAILAPVVAFAAAGPLSLEANAAYLANYAKQPGVIVRPSGLMYKIVHNGYGRRPKPTDVVTVFYTGALITGTVFDGTEASLPAQFKPNQLIQGWTEALINMREGDQWHIVIPANLAYGARGAGGGTIPPNQALVFDVTLVTVTTPKEKPEDPNDEHEGSGAE
ncbi:MAG TPA: FKBP-type peptidyl-prolyl cis-trans isomerase [Rhizomicrobium sp.]|nr:FKBP-type peptidyl-prolyl cis-trans isomerase [Rhizomicrobium sp.]